MTEPLELRLLGHVHITLGGKPVTGFVSNKAQALLCYLAITGQPQTRDDLAVLLWSDMSEAEAKANLRVALCNLRRLLPSHIVADRKSVALSPLSPCLIDVATFQDSLQQYNPAHAASINALSSAVELYRGDLLHGLQPRGALLFEEWLLLQREHLRQQVLQSYYTLAAYHLQRAEYAQALTYTTSLIKLEPWHEEAHRQAMLLFGLSGQRRLALVQYKTCRKILQQEFGVEPEAETTALYERIRDDLASLEAAPAPASDDAPRPVSRALIGRGDEFAWLMGQYEAARANLGSLTLIQGLAGTGKTSLAEEFLSFAALTGGLLLPVCCRGFSRTTPYQPIIDLLRAVFRQAPAAFAALPDYWLLELRQLLPELHETTQNLAAPMARFEPLGRQRLFEALAALLTELAQRHGEVVIFFDDLHHADSETIDILNYLICRRNGRGVWYLGTYRPEAVAAGHPLLQLYHTLQRTNRATLLKLGNLSPAAITQLVEGLEGLDADAVAMLSERLYTLAGGSPLITVRLIEDMAQQGLLCMVRGSWWLNAHRLATEPAQVPAEVQDLIIERVGQLPHETRAVLRLAAGVGQSFELGLLAQMLGVSVYEAAERLRPLLAFQIVREVTVTHEQPAEVHYTFVSSIVWRAILAGPSQREHHWQGDPGRKSRRPTQARHTTPVTRRHTANRIASCNRHSG